MARQILPKSKKQKRGPKAKPNAPRADLSEILTRFAEARAFIDVGVRLLEDDENAESAPEAMCIRHGLTLFDAAYTELDLAIAGGAK
jgi:hypothetical protein